MASLEAWVTYTRWNDAIAQEFFSGRYGGEPVYIDLEDDVLARLGESVGIDDATDPAEALIAAVTPTIRSSARYLTFGLHTGRLRRWRLQGGDLAPPVLGVLALESMVAERMRRDAELRASNYYGRFLQMIGVESTDRALTAKLAHDFADHSDPMWAALNEWILQDTSTRGVPTAYSFDHRVHVGLPMSQALVRQSDRLAIRALFAELSLRPGQITSIADMARLLRACLPSARVSSSLKRFCSDDSALSRVAAVAVVELAAWSGASEAVATRSKVALIARLRRLPRRSLSLRSALTSAPPSEPLRLGADSDDAGRCALVEPIELGAADEAGWRPIESPVSIADLLVGRVSVRSGDFEAARVPRTVTVLARDPVTASYRETDRIRLRVQHMLLVVDAARTRLERELEQIARAGFTVHDSVPGLPADWALFDGVEIVAISATTAPDLAVLIPTAWTELEVDGGLRLPGRRTWHSATAPEVRASAPPGRPLTLTITAADAPPPADTQDREAVDAGLAPDRDRRREPLHSESFEEQITYDLAELALEDGDYQLELRDPSDGNLIQSQVLIHLRSALSASSNRVGALIYRLTSPRGAISAEPAEGGGDGQDPDAGTDRVLESTEQPDELVTEPSAPERQAVDIPACFITGAHHFKLDSVARRTGWEQTFDGVCQNCGLEKRFPARPRSTRSRRDRTARRLTTAARAFTAAQPDGTSSLGYDTLLDALTYLQGGSGAGLERLISQQDDRPWATAETARALMALGHLELELDDQLRLRRWSIASTRLIPSPRGPFLAGWRSPTLMHELGRAVGALGGRVEWEPQPNGPTRIGVLGIDEDDLPALVERLSDRCDSAVELGWDAPVELARALPSLIALRATLPVLTSLPGGASLQRLDEDTLSWVAIDDVRSPGAYRTTSWPHVRLHYDGVDMRRADSRLAKWLVWPRASMLAVDPAGETVTCHRGGEPPGLFERTLVLCSGLLPIPVAEFAVQYRDVPASVARALQGRLEPAVVSA